MSLVIHPATGLPVGDPDIVPLSHGRLPSAEDMARAAAPLILSVAGWRKVFAADEESRSEKLSAADVALAGAAALAFGEMLKARTDKADAAVLVGIDSRPTGPAIADAMIRVLAGMGLRPRYLFIVPAPEIMAYAARAVRLEPGHEERAEGFCYISASHNPVGYNGIKFGLGGGVLSADEANHLIAAYTSLIAERQMPERALALMEAADRRALGRCYAEVSVWKRRSVSAYTLFAREVVTGLPDLDGQEALLSRMADEAAARAVGVVAELNGSARCLSIDRDFLEGLGVIVRSVNDRPREFAHRIVPEGESLAQAAAALEAARADDPAFALAYVPDCDGDRGNLVRFDAASGKALALPAQEVFALACVAELAALVSAGRLRYDESGEPLDKVAVVANDATSMRIEAIARAFGAEAFRAETGEANVVGLAAALREKGYTVRILGEGSNGGNITYPSKVRDPLATLGAVLKLLLLRGEETGERGAGGGRAAPREGLFHIWLRRSGRLGDYRQDFDLGDVVASLPAFATTSVFEPRAALKVESADHVALKARYAAIFAREWEARKAVLGEHFGFASWEAFASKGMTESRLGTDFAASGKGGLRIVFRDRAGAAKAFIWMRGSGTEPVFRVMADIEGGSPADEEELLAWHTAMVREADHV